MKHALSFVALLASACGPTIALPSGDAGSAETTEPSTTLDTTPTTTTPGDTGDTVPTIPPDSTGPADSTGAMTSAGFIDDPDGGGVTADCDIWAQDCPAGEKCMPWAGDGGGAWNATRCSPVVDDPGQSGDPCTVEGNGVSGIDTCDLGVMCWDVDPQTNEGVCVDLCTGSEDNWVCDDPDTFCMIAADAVLVLCLPHCDPVLQDCPEGCYPIFGHFTCAPHAGEIPGDPGDPCEFVNTCVPGNFCGDPSDNTAVCLDQGAVGCCIPFCNVQMPACANGETCVPWFDPGHPYGVGFEHVGYCTTG